MHALWILGGAAAVLAWVLVPKTIRLRNRTSADAKR